MNQCGRPIQFWVDSELHRQLRIRAATEAKSLSKMFREQARELVTPTHVEVKPKKEAR